MDSRIANIGIRWILLNHGSVIDETDPSTFYTLSRYFGHKSHYIKVLQPT
jgi:hypothetical protein